MDVHKFRPGFDLTFYGPFNEHCWRGTTEARTGLAASLKAADPFRYPQADPEISGHETEANIDRSGVEWLARVEIGYSLKPLE